MINCKCCFLPKYLSDRLAEHLNLDKSRISSVESGLREFRSQAFEETQPVQPQSAKKKSAIKRLLYSADSSTALPGRLLFSEGDDELIHPTPAKQALETVKLVCKFLNEVYNWNSFDGEGGEINITISYSNDLANAFWDGLRLIFGNGDGEIFQSFTNDPLVTAHEFFHAVTQYRSGLEYQGQNGAINEAYSDIFASQFVQWLENQTALEADWLVGKDVFTPMYRSSKVKAVRSMLNPGTAFESEELGKDPQPATYSKIYKGREDSGGVHINSGIVNRAFAIAAQKFKSYSWKEVGLVYWEAYPELNDETDFKDLAQITMDKADKLFKSGSLVSQAIESGWKTVGVL